MSDKITQELDRQLGGDSKKIKIGPISEIARKYDLDSKRLLGLLLKLDFNESQFVTSDSWKRNCGGVSRGAFVFFRIDPRAVDPLDIGFTNRITLARITNSAPTPVESNVQQTLFQVHKLQAQLDPLTSKDLQWGALKASIVGTFYDHFDQKTGEYEIRFGNDVDTFFSPFTYTAYMPNDKDLERLINSFVKCNDAPTIGELRYTETPSPNPKGIIRVQIDPADIVGEPNAAQRLANFGKTRFGKSNSNKVISQAIFESGIDVSQVFFDPSGEYTYINDQDGTSLFALNHKRSVRYSLSPRELRPDERDLGLQPPAFLRVNFYNFPGVGHDLIVSLWANEHSNVPGYMRPILDWSPDDEAPPRNQHSQFSHYWRTMGLWYALLFKAGFEPTQNHRAPINFPANVKADLVRSVTGVILDTDGNFDESGQTINVLPAIYTRISQLYSEHSGEDGWFPNSSSDGSPYFNDTEDKLLKLFSPNSNLTGHNYIRPFNRYHSPQGSSIFREIAGHVSNGTSIFIDMAQSNESVRNNLVERICRAIFQMQNEKFSSEEGVGSRFVLFYFEEAHRLFNKDDNDLNSIYNLLAKEGAKLNIGMVYSTQSMTTISPDLIKNTDNFLIAHLDDDREAREVARKYAFRDLADDVQRIQSKGYVRMITKSHRFALPVQIKLFEKP